MRLLSIPSFSSSMPDRALLHVAPPSDLCSHYHDTPHPFLRCRNPAQKYTSKCLPIAPLSLDTLVSPGIWSALTPFLLCFYPLSSISTKPRPVYFCQRGSSPPLFANLAGPQRQWQWGPTHQVWNITAVEKSGHDTVNPAISGYFPKNIQKLPHCLPRKKKQSYRV